MINKFLVSIIALCFFWGCIKDSEFRHANPYTTDLNSTAAIDRSDMCTRALEFIFWDGTGGTPWPFGGQGLNETTINSYLLCAGLSQQEIDDYIQRLFYDDDTPTAALAHEVAKLILLCSTASLPAPPADLDCYHLNLIGCGPFSSSTSPCVGCAPNPGLCPEGTISKFLIASAFANEEECIFFAWGGYQYNFVVKKSNGTLTQYNFNTTTFRQTLLASGMSLAQVDQVWNKMFLYGTMSIREFWNLFQFRVVPYFPQIPPEDKVGLQLTYARAGDGFYNSVNYESRVLYVAEGIGDLFCGTPF